jgi:hypothetical protein
VVSAEHFNQASKLLAVCDLSERPHATEIMHSISSLPSVSAIVYAGMNMPMPEMASKPHSLAETALLMLLSAIMAWVAIIGVAAHRGIITWVPWGGSGDGRTAVSTG